MTLSLDRVEALVMDFDGVFTDNKVYLDAEGRELVRCDRGDGMGISHLRAAGMPMVVLSTETNPVVAARCRKLDLDCRHGLGDKLIVLRAWLAERGLRADRAAYVGNDVNDLACMRAVGLAVAPADARDEARDAAQLVLSRKGGDGAIRELCDMLLRARGGDGGSTHGS